MTAPSPRIGLGSTIEFMTSGVEIEVTDIDWDGVSRTEHDAAHLGTAVAGLGNFGSKPKIPGKLVDGGTIKVEGHLAGDALLLIEAAKERVVVTLPLEDGQTTPDTFEFDGFAKSIKPFKAGPDEKLMVSFELVVSGEVTFTPAV